MTAYVIWHVFFLCNMIFFPGMFTLFSKPRLRTFLIHNVSVFIYAIFFKYLRKNLSTNHLCFPFLRTERFHLTELNELLIRVP